MPKNMKMSRPAKRAYAADKGKADMGKMVMVPKSKKKKKK